MSKNRRRQWMVVGLVVIAVLGFLVVRGLGNATLYFRTADEAMAQRAELGDKRFRLEGIVVPGTIRSNGTFTDFVVTSKGVNVPVQNQGQPVGIFRENIPVVLEGRFDGDTFASDRLMVRHSSDYAEQNPDRVSGSANR